MLSRRLSFLSQKSEVEFRVRSIFVSAPSFPMAGLIDVEAELARLGKRRAKLEQELARAEAKLGKESFVRNAPPEVVNQERERLDAFKRELAQLAEQHERVASLR